MHYSQSHQYDTNPQADLGSLGPYEYLLRDSDSELCKSCHNDQMLAPDVFGENTGVAYERQAGGVTTGASPYDDWKGHTLGEEVKIHEAPGLPNCMNCHNVHGGVSTTMPGSSLGCTDCHDPHGNIPSGLLDSKQNPVTSQFRNLRADGSIAGLVGISYAKGTNDTEKDVFLGSWTKRSIATNYSVSNVNLNEPVSDKSAMGQFCAECHGLFHGASTDTDMKRTGGWVRHPTADADIGAVGGTHSSLEVFRNRLFRVKVMSSTGDWGTQGFVWTNPPGDLTPTCTTCHKAHGNTRPFGLIYAKGDAELGENGDGTQLRDLCKQCHVQGD